LRTSKKSRRTAIALLTLSAGLGALVVPATAEAAQDCQPAVPDEGYRMLFDGTAASLADWSQAGPGAFVHQPDCTIVSTGGMGLLWHGEEFNAYRLRLDWKLAGDDNSGVFVGFPDPGDDPWVAVDHGYEIQIDATDSPDKTTGAIYGFQGPDVPARDEALNPPGEWNRFEIAIRGQSLDVHLNDVLINQFVNTDPERDLTQGFVGVQNHGEGDDIAYRNVQIRELGAG
jgi:cytochrome c